MSKEERIGMKMVEEDKDHIFRLEDKRSCIVRIKSKDYEHNAKKNLCEGDMYEYDPSKETEKKVLDFVNKLTQKGHITSRVLGA